MYPLKQSTAITVPFFAHDANGDGVTGLVDAGFTKRISKNGGAFAAMTVTITEMENGWYSFPLSTSHSDTLGILTISFSHASIKRVNLQFRVHARINDDFAFPNTSGRGIDVDADGGVEVDSLQTDAISAAGLSEAAAEKIADSLLARNVAGGSDGGRTVARALQIGTNRYVNSAGTATYYQTDDITTLTTATTTTDGNGNITSVDFA